MAWRFIYSVVIVPLLWVAFRVLALTNRKVRRGLRGRKTTFSDLRGFREKHPAARVLWVHASSMGEFEQAKPIIELLKLQHPEVRVVATFFSPSGYENNRRYPHADLVTYIPFDTHSNASAFLDALRPDVAAFIRYDIWPQHIWQCRARNIPVLLTNATMRANSPRLLPVLRAFHQALFSQLDFILTVSEADAAQFRRFGFDAARIIPIGDTRYDRVLAKAGSAREKNLIPPSATDGKLVIVFGSSWSEDEEVFLQPLLTLIEQRSDVLAVIVPHEPTIERLEGLEYRFRNGIRPIRFSGITNYRGEKVILVDSIGILLALYASADIAFVGGGFKSNVHNTLEPAAYGIPVIYGPKIANSQEARELAESSGGFIVEDKVEFSKVLSRLANDEAHRRGTGIIAGEFVSSRAGATEKIVGYLGPYFN